MRLSSSPRVTQLINPEMELRHLARVWTPDHVGQCWLLALLWCLPIKENVLILSVNRVQGTCVMVSTLQTFAD